MRFAPAFASLAPATEGKPDTASAEISTDPSYLPALEQHIAGLRADRETARAMDAAGYVLASLTAEIDAFTQVAEAMHRKLSQMDPAQRAEIEEASKILRRARAARTLPLIPHAAPVTETA
jgi:BMFP domain-containing protein YqiC